MRNRNPILLALLLGICLFAFGKCVLHAQTDEEIKNIPAADIIKTQQHAIQLLQEALTVTKAQNETLADARVKNTELQAKIDKLAAHDQDCAISSAKKDARIWKDNMLFVIIGVTAAGYLFLKFYLHLPI